MALAAGLDLGGSAVKAWVVELDGRMVSHASAPVRVLRSPGGLVEIDPAVWWSVAAGALRQAVADAARPADEYAGVTASSLRQGFVLTDGSTELGSAVLNSDRRGASHLAVLRDRVGTEALYRTTGHWPAPELTLPKLLNLVERQPQRWELTRRVLFIHDWALWRLSGEVRTEASLASSGQMADVAARGWAEGLLDDLGLGTGRLAPVVEAGTVVGSLRRDDLGLPVGLPVVAGGGDTQSAAMGAAGLVEGVVTVVAGSSTPVQACVERPVLDPDRRPWVSTHLSADRWALETNAGYPGTMLAWLAGVLGTDPDGAWDLASSGRPGAGGLTAVVATPRWCEEAWATKAPGTILGLRPSTTPADLARAVVEAHAFAVRTNLEDLEDALGLRAPTVVVGGGGASPGFVALLADVLGRDLVAAEGPHPAARAGAALVARATGAGELAGDPPPARVVPAGDPRPYSRPFERFLEAHAALRAHLPEDDGS